MNNYQDIIYYEELLTDLKSRSVNNLFIPPIITFMNTLGWYWDSRTQRQLQAKHAKNSVKWFQKFINGYLLEKAFYENNKNIVNFIEENHSYLKAWSTGNPIPDFKFIYENKEYTIDTKTSSNVLEKCTTLTGLQQLISSFHGADFGCMFCMHTKQFYWFYKIGNSYSRPCLLNELPDIYKECLGRLTTPTVVEMLKIEVPSDSVDSQLPKYAFYNFTKYTLNI